MPFIRLSSDSVTVTTDYTVQTTDRIVLCDASAGPLTVTLPSAASMVGLSVTIRKSDETPNVVTVQAQAGDTLDGSGTLTLSNKGDAVILYAKAAGTWIAFSGGGTVVTPVTALVGVLYGTFALVGTGYTVLFGTQL